MVFRGYCVRATKDLGRGVCGAEVEANIAGGEG